MDYFRSNLSPTVDRPRRILHQLFSEALNLKISIPLGGKELIVIKKKRKTNETMSWPRCPKNIILPNEQENQPVRDYLGLKSFVI